MNFEELLSSMYPINDKNNKLKKFIQNNFNEMLLTEYVQELAIYMIAATKVSGGTILEKILYEKDIDHLSEKFDRQKVEIIKDDIYFELKEDEDDLGFFFIKANEEVLTIIEEDIELFTELKHFILN